MAQTVLGLDIGQDTVRGVRIGQGLRGLRVLDIFEQEVPKEEVASGLLCHGQMEALKQLISDGKIRPNERITVALPGQFVSFRTLVLPFTDTRKIEQVVPSELEAHLPFDLEEVIVDSFLTQSNKDVQTSHVLAVAVQKTVLKQYLDALQELGLNPSVVGLDTLALYLAYTSGHAEQHIAHGAALLIDIGASKTVLAVIAQGHLRSVRTLLMGGDDITATLQHVRRLSWEEAEIVKMRSTLDPMEADDDGVEVATCIKEALTPWLREIEKSCMDVSAFYLCGGGSLLKGLSDYIAQALQLSPISWQSEIQGINRQAVPTYMQGLGLALSVTQPERELNLRQGTFLLHQSSSQKQRQLLAMGFGVLVVVSLLVAGVYLRHQQVQQRYKSLKETLHAGFVRLLPNAPRASTSEIEQVEAIIRTTEQTHEWLEINRESPLATLRALTMAIPPEVPIDVHEFSVDGNKVRVAATTRSYDMVDQIRGGLLGVPHFQDVNVSGAKTSPGSSSVEFDIQFSVGPLQDLR